MTATLDHASIPRSRTARYVVLAMLAVALIAGAWGLGKALTPSEAVATDARAEAREAAYQEARATAQDAAYSDEFMAAYAEGATEGQRAGAAAGAASGRSAAAR